MRIALAVPTRGFSGGREKHARDLAVGLRARGHHVILLAGTQPGRDDELYAAGFDEVVEQAAPGLARAREAFAAVRDRVDVVYVQLARRAAELEAYGDVPLLVASHDHDLTCVRSHRYLPLTLEACHRAPGITCVLHGCALVRDTRPEALLPVRLASPFQLKRDLAGLARRARLVTCSRYIAEQVVRAGVSPERVRAIHPIPPEDSRPLVPRPVQPRLLFVGGLLRGKGADLAISALAQLPADVHLTVLGDGPQRAELERQASREAPGRVTFTGWLPPAGVASAYDEARVVLVPSRWPEPFGMVGIEAMRRARPVVAPAHGGVPEWLTPGTGGELFRPGDVASLARAIAKVLADDEAGVRALRDATARFPHSKLIDEIEALLAEVAAAAQVG